MLWSIDWRLAGGRAWPFHLTNLLAHAGAAVLLCLLAWNGDPRAAIAAGALFAIHPLATEAVDSLLGGTDVLATLLLLGCFVVHRREGRAAAIAAPLLLAGALLCKESALLGLPLLAIFDARERIVRRRWIGHLAATAVVLALRHHVVGALANAPMPGHPLAGSAAIRLLGGLRLFAHAARLFALPLGLQPDYGAAVVVPSRAIDVSLIAGTLLATVLALLLARALRRRERSADGLALALIPSLFATNTFVLMPVAMAERWLYLPLAGACLLAGALWAKLAARRLALALVAAGLVGAAFVPVDVIRAREWSSGEALWTAALVDEPESASANYNAGVFREAAGADDEALALFLRAGELDPRWGEPHAAAGTILARRGNLDEAGRAFERMRAGWGASGLAWRNYAAYLERVGRGDEAAKIRARVR
jgi:hypothetical protein